MGLSSSPLSAGASPWRPGDSGHTRSYTWGPLATSEGQVCAGGRWIQKAMNKNSDLEILSFLKLTVQTAERMKSSKKRGKKFSEQL